MGSQTIEVSALLLAQTAFGFEDHAPVEAWNPLVDESAVGTLPQGISPEGLKALFRDHPAGVAVVTTDGPDGPVAMTASSLFSVSVAPPLVVFSASALSSSTPALLAADTVVVHLIDSESVDIAILGATSNIDRFANPDQWSRLPGGEPYYLKPSKRFRAKVVNTLDAGAATLIVLEVLEGWVEERSTHPLVYHSRAWHTIGEHSLLNIP